jgi:peptidoglycan/xylan/chitin deacetylase (PgdA/CDA1 family)
MKSLLRLYSPAGERARLTVLIFHRVFAQPDPLFPDEMHAERFDALLGWIKAWFQVLPLDQAAQMLAADQLPARAAVLSFDDGYADNAVVALPLLRQHGLPCSFFIATDFLNGGRMWNDSLIEAIRLTPLPALDLRGLAGGKGQDLGQVPVRTVEEKRQAIPKLLLALKYLHPEIRQQRVDDVLGRAQANFPTDLMMNTAQLRSLRAHGMQIGGHTASHPILASLNAAEAGDEIARGKAQLEALLGERISLFAYPNGKPDEDYLPARDPGLVRELGFEAAVTTQWGAARKGSDLFQLPRFTPWDRTRLRFGLRLVHNLASR